MIENKLHIKLWSLNRLGEKLLRFHQPAYTSTFQLDGFVTGETPAVLLKSASHIEGAEGTDNDAETPAGLKAAAATIQGSIKQLSDKLNNLSIIPLEGKSTLVKEHSSEKYFKSLSSVTSVKGKPEGIIPGFLRLVDIPKVSQVVKGSSIGLIFRLKETRLLQNESIYSTSEKVNNVKSLLSNEHNSLQLLKEANYKLERNTIKKEKLLEADLFKKINLGEKKQQEKPSYTIHQNFGDIIIQPASIDVSMNQLKVKIQDILRQARDSMY